MSSTVFIAVQCCQCSTMQVKQKKKSSNKWTCVVCNQKQSVIKVFAQGFIAKDLRKFVQSFNLSRGNISDNTSGQLETLTTPSSSTSSDLEASQRKRRSDWTEYLDLQHHHHGNNETFNEGGDAFEPKIVTELTKEMFKKPKLNNYDQNNDNINNSYKPVFSKRKTTSTNQQLLSQGKENKERRTNQPTKASKWNAYVTHDDNVGTRINIPDDTSQCSHDVWETIFDDQNVEDDIHPDFV